MFRGNPAHNFYVIAPGNEIYDTKEWQFDAGSPVRSTPLISDNTVYFGTAGGIFFAIDKKTTRIKWQYHTGYAIHSSPALQKGRIYFSDNSQAVYCLDKATGRLLWKTKMGEKRAYPWRYDYYYSSPVLHEGKLLIGGDDGFFYALHAQTGKLLWKHSCKGIIRSTAAVYKNLLLFGDTEATFYALDMEKGEERWQYHINGDTINNEQFGFDRHAINSSPVIAGNKIIFGARDGFLYCINADTGENIWKVDHHVSWVISTVAIRDSIVVTGTSDGRFVQAINLETGRELWKCRTQLAVWSSPLIINDKVYAGSFDGQLYCIDLYTGQAVSRFRANGKIMSSPVWEDGLLYIGADDGYLYALKGHTDRRMEPGNLKRYVYYEPGTNIYFRNNSDLLIRNYLRANGYKVIGSDSLVYFLSQIPAAKTIIVFASCYFPPAIINNGKNSLVRKFLDAGGRMVLNGTNATLYQVDETSKTAVAFRPGAIDTVFDLDYGKGDTRSFMGDFPSFPTEAGRRLGLPAFWSSSAFIDEKKVDIVLGKNENGEASSYVKNYSNGGRLVQLWMDADRPDHLDAIIKAAEWELE